jgi:arylsulfatase A-like enzyme
MIFVSAGLLFASGLSNAKEALSTSARPNIVLIMTDDQGWGETGYSNHPILKTPNLDAMAANGLRFDRFYASSPVCSSTRASVLTGRANDRTGVPTHGHALRLQEKTLAAALKASDYATGHFGKWHLSGLSGPGVPVFGDDTHNPGRFGFDEWLTVSNFFDVDPIMSHNGTFVEFKGDSSSILVEEALKFISASTNNKKPFLAVIWYGSPHHPWIANDADIKPFENLDSESQHHYGELVAVDRSVGVLRKGLRDLGIANNTLVWFSSDNGGIARVSPDTRGGLRGNKGSIWEGGIRVPAIVEWPASIDSRITVYPASTMDIFPTIADILDLPDSVMLKPVDGISLSPLFAGDIGKRNEPIPFRFGATGALVDNNYKLVTDNYESGIFELYDLQRNPQESRNISQDEQEIFKQMRSAFMQWSKSVDESVAGKDYPEGKVLADQPVPHDWMTDKRYAPFIAEWKTRPEYSEDLKLQTLDINAQSNVPYR